MAKPTALAPWATDANYPAGAEPEAGTPTKVAYTLGQATLGWRPKGKPPAQELNTWMNRVGKWVDFVNETVYAASVDYALTANANDFDPLGTGSLGELRTINVAPDADDWVVRALVGGIDGREVDIVNTGAFRFFITDQDGAGTAINRLSLPDSVIAVNAALLLPPGAAVRVRYRGGVTNRWYVISMSGCMKRDKLVVPAAAAQSPNAVSMAPQGHLPFGAAGVASFVYFPISLPVGAWVVDWLVYLKKLSGAGITINVSLLSRAINADGTTTVSTDAVATAAPGYIARGQSSVDYIVPAATLMHYVQVARDDDAAQDHVLAVLVDAWVPF